MDYSYTPFSPETLNALEDAEPRLRANSWPFKRPRGESELLETLSPASTASCFNCIPEIMEVNSSHFNVERGDVMVSLPPPSCERSAANRPKSQKKPWGEKSYAAIITEAIETSAEQKMTLQDIYDYFIANYEYFAKRTDCNSSGGWKNSIRHNLSLHSKFQRLENCESGKSAFWIVCDASNGGGVQKQVGYPRRRATVGCAQREILRKSVRRAKSRITICGHDVIHSECDVGATSYVEPLPALRQMDLSSGCSSMKSSLTGLASRFSDMDVKELVGAASQSNCYSSNPSLPFQVDPRELVLGPHKDLPGDQILVNLVVDAVVYQHHQHQLFNETNNNFLCSSDSSGAGGSFPCYSSLQAPSEPVPPHVHPPRSSEDNCASALSTQCCSELHALLF